MHYNEIFSAVEASIEQILEDLGKNAGHWEFVIPISWWRVGKMK